MRSAEQLVHDARFYLSRKLNRSLVPPDRVSVNVTLRCNLKCTMCTTCYDAPELSTAEIKGIIDQTAAWGVEVFNPLGGEPFMRADIEELLAYAVRRGFYVTVTTNGTLITQGRADRISAVPADRLHFNVSLDGDAAAHDMVRGAGMWKRAIQGYQRVRAADAAAGNARRKILSNTILHRHNLHRFEAVLDEQAQLGFDGVQILNLFRAEQAPDTPPPEAAGLWFRPADMPVLERLVERLAQRVEAQGPAGYRIQNRAADLRKIPSYYTQDLTPLEAPCWAGWKELYINADGAAIMCDGQLDFLAGTFGNARDQTLRQLWASPALRQRRQVVRTCATPCIQDCYLRRESDSGRKLVADAARLGAKRLRGRVARLRPKTDHRPDAVLRLELTDVRPGGWDQDSPQARWLAVVRDAPGAARPDLWGAWRDQGYLDFGRGFMGGDVARGVCDDLRRSGLRLGTVALGWRGEPLLHPELESILDLWLDAIARDHVADRLRIPTSGAWLTPGALSRAGVPLPVGRGQDWVVDLDPDLDPGLAAVRALVDAAAPSTRVVATVAARSPDDLDRVRALLAALPGFAPRAGRFPGAPDGHCLWIRRTDHAHFLENQAARTHLGHVAAGLGLSADLGVEDHPRRCVAPDLTPTVSWDGKITLCPRDVRMDNRVGDVTSGLLSQVWAGPDVAAARRSVAARGVPDRALCADCALPWSPNLP